MAASKIGRMIGAAAPAEDAAEEETEMADDERESAKSDAGLALKAALSSGDGTAIADAVIACHRLSGD